LAISFNNLIIQWTAKYNSPEADEYYSYPITFKSKLFYYHASRCTSLDSNKGNATSNGISARSPYVVSYDLTGLTIRHGYQETRVIVIGI